MGYTTARDIIRRDYAQSLEYAKKMNIRCMLVISAEQEQYQAVRSIDGCTIQVGKSMIARPGLINYIEESQGEN
jgi:ATP phosphoribosyltransferase regulatory subunit